MNSEDLSIFKGVDLKITKRLTLRSKSQKFGGGITHSIEF